MKHIRRQFVQGSLQTLLAAGMWPGVLDAKEVNTGSFHFVAVNDLHYFNEKCVPWFERMVKAMTSQPEKIDFVLISGDLTEHGTQQQNGVIRDILKTLPFPYHVVVGNHDYQGPSDRTSFDQLFPKQINYHFEHAGWQFIGLDTSEGQKSKDVKAPQATFQWLDDQLPRLNKSKPTILFTHFPLVFGVPFILQNAKPLLERFASFNLKAVYSGHYHGFTERKFGQTVLTTNQCCSFARANHDRSPGKGFFVCSVADGKLNRSMVELK
ncbi:MAG: metallophosphoesterase [Planctomycetia bacterium]|nr:metallophosphoesterase [Planctomycetia bacterium]